MTNKILDDILDAIEMDEERKKALLQMPTDELLLAIFSIQQYIRGEIATVKKKQLLFEQDYKQYRDQREEREREILNGLNSGDDDDDDIPITQKMMRVAAQEVAKAFANRFDWGVYLRDRVLPGFISTAITILIIMMGLFMSGKWP